MADCQLNASGAPSPLYGFHRGRNPWCTWDQARLVQGIISRMRSDVAELWGAGVNGCAERPSLVS